MSLAISLLSCYSWRVNSETAQRGRQPIRINGKDVNLHELNRLYGLDPSYLSRILNGRQDPERVPVGTMFRLASALQMDILDLMEELDSRFHKTDLTAA